MFDETVNPFIIIFHDKLKEEPVENVDHDYSSHERITNFFYGIRKFGGCRCRVLAFLIKNTLRVKKWMHTYFGVGVVASARDHDNDDGCHLDYFLWRIIQ